MRCEPQIVRKWIEGILSGIYLPEPDEEIWEWAERTLRIPATENEEMANQYWSSSLSPYVRELFEWFKRPGKGEFWIQKSSQVGFTMACLILLCWMLIHRSGNMIYAIDSEKQAREVSKTRLKKWITLNGLLEKIGESEDDMSNLTYFLKGITVYMVGSHAAGSWATKSCVLVILDEVDKQPFIEGEGWTTDLARERIKRPKNAKIIGFSTPGETGQIGKEVSHGTCEEIRVPFPCCGHKQSLKWDNFVFGTEEFRDLAGEYDLERVEHDAYFKCELCGGRLYEKDKYDALQKYEYVATNSKANPRIRSLKIWDAYSLFITFGELALGWIKAQGDPTKVEAFMRGKRGEYYTRSGGQISESELLDLRAPYRRGTCPAKLDVILYAMSVDIQKDCMKCTKTVFDPSGNMYIVDWREVVTFDELVEFADEPLETMHGKMQVMCGLIDEGNDAADVRSFCLLDTRFYPVKGRGGDQVRSLITLSPQWHDGQEVDTYHIDDHNFKWMLLNRLKRETYSLKRKEKVKKLRLPEDVIGDEDFLMELCQEFPIRAKNMYGVEKWRWKRTSKPNDWWDTLKYLLCVWSIMSDALIRAREMEEKTVN